MITYLSTDLHVLYNCNKLFQRYLRHSSKKIVLGIESTFDDTGVAIVNEHGDILADALYTQTNEHLRNKGVNPSVAQVAHEQNLPLALNEVMTKASMSFNDLSALATATRPGLSLCLGEGLKFSQSLLKKHMLPFIPVHHMEAHLLTARLSVEIPFPFLSLLVSGGHCILCLALDLGQYRVLGETLDEPPGAAFDKVARALKYAKRDSEQVLKGKDLAALAEMGNCHHYKLVVPFSTKAERHCDFSFAGLQTQALRHLQAATSIQDEADVAAWFQYNTFKHILSKTQRAILFCKNSGLIPSSSTLVVSGGVASNTVLNSALNVLCNKTKMDLVVPPKQLCVDNGIMIAWAGMEYLLSEKGFSDDPFNEKLLPKAGLGPSIRQEVIKSHIKLPKIDFFGL